MLDCSNYVRSALYTALNGNVSYESKSVYVYKDAHFDTPPQKYIVIGDINETGRTLNNNTFINDVEVNIEIFVEQYRYQAQNVVDAISSSVLAILFPTPLHHNIGDNDVAIYAIDRVSSRYLPLQDGDNFVSRKILTIKFLVNQE